MARQEQAAADEAKARALAEQDEFEREVLALRHELAKIRLELELRRFQRKYSPDQPRVPAGNPDGGQWTDGGGEGAGRDAPSTDFSAQARRDNIQLAADNQRQNKMVRDVVVRLRLSKDQRQELHRAISGQEHTYLEILDIAKEMFGK